MRFQSTSHPVSPGQQTVIEIPLDAVKLFIISPNQIPFPKFIREIGFILDGCYHSRESFGFVFMPLLKHEYPEYLSQPFIQQLPCLREFDFSTRPRSFQLFLEMNGTIQQQWIKTIVFRNG